MAKSKLEGLSAAEQRNVVMAFLFAQFDTPYWRGTAELTVNTRFDEDLSFSELDMAMLINDAQEEFGIIMPDTPCNEMRTFDDFIKVVIKS